MSRERMEQFLLPGERLGDVTPLVGDGRDFDIWGVSNPDMKPTDRVLLDIRDYTGVSVLIGGNPLELEVLQGRGIMVMVDLKTGESLERFLLEGSPPLAVPSDNIAYSYENCSPERSLVVRDTCPDFNMAHEPRLEEVAAAVGTCLSLLYRL